MNKQEFAAWEQRIAARADHLWNAAGRPDGPRDRFTEAARELIAIEENPGAGRVDPEDTGKPIVEEAALQANLGEFPGFSDRQGEEPMFPAPDDEPSPH